MKRLILAGTFALLTTGAQSQSAGTGGTGSNQNSRPVQGYSTGTGTYVPPRQPTNPSGTQRDSSGTTGNVNPSTGTGGTRTPK